MALTGDFVTGQNLAFARMRRRDQDCGLQEGVVEGSIVEPRAAGANMSVDVGAGSGWVQIDTGIRNGISHYLGTGENVLIAEANNTLPRVDQIVLQYNDSSIPAGIGGNIPSLRVLTGTPTSTANKDNRLGAAALPNDCQRLADVEVPAKATKIEAAQIRDRRTRAGGFDIFKCQSAEAAVKLGEEKEFSGLTARIESTGNPLIVTFSGMYLAEGNATVNLKLLVNAAEVGAGTEIEWTVVNTELTYKIGVFEILAPPAGSLLLTATTTVSSGKGKWLATTTEISLGIREILFWMRANQQN